MAEENEAINAFGFFASVIGSLAWPLLVAVLIFTLRKRIGRQFSRIVELSFPGGSMKFRDTMNATKATAEEALNDLRPRHVRAGSLKSAAKPSASAEPPIDASWMKSSPGLPTFRQAK
jgi:hypothetical protein